VHYPKPFEQLIKEFSALPSIGPKMAERLVLYLFKQDPETLLHFSESLKNLTALKQCSECFHICEEDVCNICMNTKRDRSTICIVEDPLDVISLERTGVYHGLYHVLGGTIEPSAHKEKNDQLTIAQLLKRLKKTQPKEVIIATNPTAEGDITALYLKRKLSEYDLKITRLARGLSTGGDIEYADEETLSSALTNRIHYD
jgi:recombination protein RecR